MKLTSFAWPLAALVVGCIEPRPRPPGRACVAVPPPPASVAAPAPSTPSPSSTPSPDERFYPGGDDARTTTRRRYRTAVLLFAPPRPPRSDEPLEVVDTLSFQPVLCTIDGVIGAGQRCGEIMPRAVTVRLTDASSGHDTMDLMRSAVPYVTNTDDGPVTFPAPYGPSCCMYRRCVGRTIPYRPLAAPGTALTTSKTILAVWPADADIDLQPRSATTDDPAAHGWTLARMGARKLLELATSDIDHDGRTESLVYEWWANDYGLDVLVRGTAAPIHAFSCGNI